MNPAKCPIYIIAISFMIDSDRRVARLPYLWLGCACEMNALSRSNQTCSLTFQTVFFVLSVEAQSEGNRRASRRGEEETDHANRRERLDADAIQLEQRKGRSLNSLLM